jgi:hypothetical protein
VDVFWAKGPPLSKCNILTIYNVKTLDVLLMNMVHILLLPAMPCVTQEGNAVLYSFIVKAYQTCEPMLPDRQEDDLPKEIKRSKFNGKRKRYDAGLTEFKTPRLLPRTQQRNWTRPQSH